MVFGSSTAGGAYHPALSDYTIFVKDQAQVFLGGPPLVKMATGEVVDSETLGGAEMHSSQSGLSDNLASDEFTAILPYSGFSSGDLPISLKFFIMKAVSFILSIMGRYEFESLS